MTYDPLKSNPNLAKAFYALKNRTALDPNDGPSLGWADGIEEKTAITMVVTLFISGGVLWFVFFFPRSPLSKPLVACLLFLFFRGTLDLFMGFHENNAMNFMMGIISLISFVMITSLNQHLRGLLWGGCYMLLRGTLNIVLFVWISSDVLVEALFMMPLTALPNFTISYILPFVIGSFLIKTYRQKA